MKTTERIKVNSQIKLINSSILGNNRKSCSSSWIIWCKTSNCSSKEDKERGRGEEKESISKSINCQQTKG